ncbi:TetR/AcrR family transcriptional regulator [Nocardia wallacei]|uniref:TetR/AcrR family transcriptional regulator n=1 Tax=Nocardia wallacei TaxID=480035 RepID=UPI0024543E94|nr:TetR/AcrR family transcriptional regulator [Nocardia wallacei]
MTRTKPPAQRRGELLDAAEQLLVNKGVDAFTVDDVTVSAGVAKGTFYLHFSNKADLLNALRDRYVRRFADTQLAAARRVAGVAGIEEWMRAGVSEYLREIRLHDVLFHPATYDREAPNPPVETLSRLLAELRPAPPDPLATAVILYSAMHGATDHIAHKPDDENRMLDALTQLCRDLLAPGGSRPSK